MAEDLFDKWNPLVEHYNDKKSNTYETGPAANLSSELLCPSSK